MIRGVRVTRSQAPQGTVTLTYPFTIPAVYIPGLAHQPPARG